MVNYDSHLFIHQIATKCKGDVKVIAHNKEKYLCITKSYANLNVQFIFIDSFCFLSSSLAKLAKTLSEDKLINLKQNFFEISEEALQLVFQKCTYFYDYFDSPTILEETQLPEKIKFYNILTDSHITDEDYKHAQTVWREFQIKNLREYTLLYLKVDVLLLADIFQSFRARFMRDYSLDVAHYISLPSFTYDACLKYTKIKLDVLQDINMVLFIERGIRGGLSQVSHRYSKANNKYMTDKDFNPCEPSSYILYLDVNNLYGKAMTLPLPYANFVWLQPDKITNFNIEENVDLTDYGFILEVDLLYPDTLHDEHNDLPFCVHKVYTESENNNKHEKNKSNIKLCATFLKKERYIVHIKTLHQALRHGIKLEKIHRILKFNHSTWLKDYIDFNVFMRQQALSVFEQNLYKLLINAFFGKSIENVRFQTIIKLCTEWAKKACSLIASTKFHSLRIFAPDFLAIEMNKSKICFNKPIYVGMVILDYAKFWLYRFFYDVAKPYFEARNEKMRLIYTDTDSLLLEIKSHDAYSFIRDIPDEFDTSNFADDNPYGIVRRNKKVMGLMKIEEPIEQIREIVALRAKMYAYELYQSEDCKCSINASSSVDSSANSSSNADVSADADVSASTSATDPTQFFATLRDCKVVKKSKGLKRYVVENNIKFDDYKTCLFDYIFHCNKNVDENVVVNEKCYEQKLIKSHCHRLYSLVQNKIGLRANDTKRKQKPYSFKTYALGYKGKASRRRRLCKNDSSSESSD